jgi:hypothetical protein
MAVGSWALRFGRDHGCAFSRMGAVSSTGSRIDTRLASPVALDLLPSLQGGGMPMAGRLWSVGSAPRSVRSPIARAPVLPLLNAEDTWPHRPGRPLSRDQDRSFQSRRVRYYLLELARYSRRRSTVGDGKIICACKLQVSQKPDCSRFPGPESHRSVNERWRKR